MISIFYDLETTDTSFIGQILNYSFIVVNEDYEIIDEYSGLVSVDRLQLPSPGAILANRTDILEHQKNAKDSDVIVIRNIFAFLSKTLEEVGDDVAFVGFNSKKFDLTYLRTTAIRYGINPYLKSSKQKRLLNCDLLHVLRKLVTINSEFALVTLKEDPKTGSITRSMSLEHVSRQFNLLSGKQSHESREDVLLTIELAKFIHKRYGLDVRRLRTYEGEQFHSTSRSGKIFFQRSPEYDTSLERDYAVTPVTLLDFKGTSALWIDLSGYELGKGKESIFWRNTNDGLLFLEEGEANAQYIEIAMRALQEFQSITTDNFFARTTCDIEQDIFRLDFSDRDALSAAIWKGDTSLIKRSENKDVQELYTRFKLKRYAENAPDVEKAEKLVAAYAYYRYGGQIKLSKREEVGHVENSTLNDHVEFLKNALASPSEDTGLLESLRVFYAQSDIVRIAGESLITAENRLFLQLK